MPSYGMVAVGTAIVVNNDSNNNNGGTPPPPPPPTPPTLPAASSSDHSPPPPSHNASPPSPQSHPQPSSQPSHHPSTATTRVDGKGLWRSWKRNFKDKLLALLDLIDNSLDAALVTDNDDGNNGNNGNEGFVGRVHIYPDEVSTGSYNAGGVTGSMGSTNAAATSVTSSKYFDGGSNSNDSMGANNNDSMGLVKRENNMVPEPIPSASSSALVPAAVSSSAVSSGVTAAASSCSAFIDLSQSDDEEDVQQMGQPDRNPPSSVRPTLPSSSSVHSTTKTITTGLCVVNNCLHPVRPLARVLEVYNSSKIDSGSTNIGENGVGLKQGCATLSDLSFVLVKNGKDGFVELGMVAESLQRAEGCYLPAFRFQLSSGDDAIESLKEQMTALFAQPEHGDVVRCVEKYGSVARGESAGLSDAEKGIDRLLKHFHDILNFYDNDYVFAVVLDHVSYGSSNQKQHRMAASSSSTSSSDDPIKDLRLAIPRTYLHVPPSFDFRIGDHHTCGLDRDRVVFHYWPQRLVELSSFTVMVSETTPWYYPSEEGSYKLRVFLGFDRFRIHHQDAIKAASMYIYSRESGRLIKHEPDARFLLGLNASGSMYCSGLTVLIDDVEGKLPLNPTKQDVAFGEQDSGEVHRNNLHAWVAAVTKFFYDYHLAKFDGKKLKLTEKIKECGTDPVDFPLKEIDRSRLTTFDADIKHYARKSIRLDRNSAKEIAGSDTHFPLVRDPSEYDTNRTLTNKRQFVPVPAAPPGADAESAEKRRRIIAAPPQFLDQPTSRGAVIPSHHHSQAGIHQHAHSDRGLPPQQHYPSQYQQPHPIHPHHANGHNPHALQATIHHSQMPQLTSSSHHQQQHGHEGAAMSNTGQPFEPPSPTVSGAATGATGQRQGAQSRSPTRPRVRRARTNASRSPSSLAAIGNVEGPSVEEEEDDDEDQTTKKEYKELCAQLIAKIERKKGVEKENQRLKREIAHLKGELEGLKAALEPIPISLEGRTPLC